MYSTEEEPNPEKEEQLFIVHMAPGCAIQFLKLETTPPPSRKSKAARPVAPADEEEDEDEEEGPELFAEDVTIRTSSISALRPLRMCSLLLEAHKP